MILSIFVRFNKGFPVAEYYYVNYLEITYFPVHLPGAINNIY